MEFWKSLVPLAIVSLGIAANHFGGYVVAWLVEMLESEKWVKLPTSKDYWAAPFAAWALALLTWLYGQLQPGVYENLIGMDWRLLFLIGFGSKESIRWMVKVGKAAIS